MQPLARRCRAPGDERAHDCPLWRCRLGSHTGSATRAYPMSAPSQATAPTSSGNAYPRGGGAVRGGSPRVGEVGSRAAHSRAANAGQAREDRNRGKGEGRDRVEPLRADRRKIDSHSRLRATYIARFGGKGGLWPPVESESSTWWRYRPLRLRPLGRAQSGRL